jgi:hypothetical protein
MYKLRSRPFLPGDRIKVRTLQEIKSTLDKNGTLDGLPFMPEMVAFCGSRHWVSKRLERTCEESEKGMRRIKNVIFLDHLRCDGSSHGDCQKRCMLFWKDAWVRKDEGPSDSSLELIKELDQDIALPSRLPDGSYICQSTELVRATTPLSLFDFMSYFRDIRSRTYTIPKLIQVLFYAFFLRFRYYLTGTPFRFLRGTQKKTPEASLNLRPGDWVQVKSQEEIRATLDEEGMNRGLRFTLDMIPYCGGTYRVLSRIEAMVYEPTRELIRMKDTVILENSVCKGCHIIKGGCPRENYNFWREIWLRRVPRA